MHIWRRINAEGIEWEVRMVTEPDSTGGGEDRDIIEFRPLSGEAQPRRTAVGRDTLEAMTDEDLAAVYRRAAPIAADHYGRPGKSMRDAR